MDIATLVLEYVRVALSAPVIFGLIACIAIFLFKADIHTLIGRIATIKLPGGGELSTSQQARTTEETSQQQPPDVPSDEQVTIPKEIELSKEQLVAVRELYLNERANAYLWEYRYLNHYLVMSTQYVLDWIAVNQQPTSLSLFDNFWTPRIQSAQEREAIINALQSHHLILDSDGLVTITPKGREYIEWRGPLDQSG